MNARKKSVPAFRRPSLLSLALAGVACALLAASAQDVGQAPIKNFVLPIFTREGPRAATLRGSEASRPNAGQIDIVDFNLTRFSGDASQQVDDVLLAPFASFFPDQNLAKGDKGVRAIRDEMELTGDVWTYNHTQKKVTVDGHVRVVFQTQMKDILK